MLALRVVAHNRIAISGYPTPFVTDTSMPSPSIYNVPNALTTVRFALAIAVVVLIPMRETWPALVVFLIAVSTDWMDGYWARKYGQVTKLGRIFDPFVDKIIICGSFIALVEVDDSPVKSWMATVVVARELLVTSLRGIIEGAGGDFSASWLGKWKMVVQCAAVVAALLTFVILPVPAWLSIATQVLLWGAIFITVYSGVDYTLIAARVMQADPNTLTQAAATATAATAAADASASEPTPDETASDAPAAPSSPAPREDETTADSLSDRT